ncbi:TetR/AcrR family transcriptional regulator [Streptomyces sp. NPDC127172]|uniref:TetR/AcrR family transcriptional regulator n=1 Tax=Streptomyces sp. NPDC127172 TaxID=3345382 RepID=UPI003636618D
MASDAVEIGLRGSVVRDPEQREKQRREILSAAARVFARKGYETTTMVDIAKEMGVSKGILYYQFRSKQELIVATRRQASGSAADRLEEIVARPVPVTERMQAALRDLITTNFDEFARHVILITTNLGLDAEHTAIVREIERRYEHLLAGLLREGIANGSFVDADIRLTTFTLIRAGQSPAIWYRPGGTLTPEQVVSGVTEQLMRSVLTPRADAS